MNQRTLTVVVTELAGHGYKLDVADSGVTKEPSHEHALLSDALAIRGALGARNCSGC